MYDGTPSIRLEGDKARALALVPDAKALLARVQDFVQASGVSTFGTTRRVSDDTYIYVLIAQGMLFAHISVDPHAVDTVLPPEEPLEAPALPDIYSGVVFTGLLEDRVRTVNGQTQTYKACTGFAPTPDCIESHPRDGLVPGRQSVARLGVAPWVAFDELLSRSPLLEFSQYTRLRPSMYSGLMQKVVQVVMGLGRISKNTLFDPGEMMTRQKLTQYMRDVDGNGVQVRYDYKFQRTHGITRATDGRLWLVEISVTNGVIARPLPIFKGSDNENYAERYRSLGDNAAVTLLDELGCWPTGEAFPPAAALAAAITQGDVIRLALPSELSPFYQCTPYSTAMGWAFSPSGNEAHNTGYYFGDDGFQRGVWYQVSISIGATNPDREPGTPIATGSAALRKQQEGKLWSSPQAGNSPRRWLPVKFHEPLLPGLVSHDAVPLRDLVDTSAPIPKCDTVMWVGFIDGSLRTVRYYRNGDGEAYAEAFTNVPEDCPLDGSWYTSVKSGTRSFAPMPYTNDFDDRRVVQEYSRQTTYESVGLAHTGPDVSDIVGVPDVATVFRYREFKVTTNEVEQQGEIADAAVLIPAYNREAYYYASGRAFLGGSTGFNEVEYVYIRDPNMYYAWRDFPHVGAYPWPTPRCRDDACGRKHKDRKIVCDDFLPSLCSDFADSGGWMTTCSSVTPVAPRFKTRVYTPFDRGRDESVRSFLVATGSGGPIPLGISYGQFENRWMMPSPSPLTNEVQQIRCTHSAIGQDGLVYQTDLQGYGTQALRGYAPDAVSEDDNPCFVGVNAP